MHTCIHPPLCNSVLNNTQHPPGPWPLPKTPSNARCKSFSASISMFSRKVTRIRLISSLSACLHKFKMQIITTPLEASTWCGTPLLAPQPILPVRHNLTRRPLEMLNRRHFRKVGRPDAAVAFAIEARAEWLNDADALGGGGRLRG